MASRLIVPLDQSTVSESVLPLAHGLAAQLGVPVTLIAIADLPRSYRTGEIGDPPSAPTTMGGYPTTGTPPDAPHGFTAHEHAAPPSGPSAEDVDKLADQTAELEQYLQQISTTFGNARVETIVRPGDPAEWILDTAAASEEPLIVMASHGRSGIQRAVIGSVTASVVQSATCPVFVVRGASEPAAEPESVTIETVLVPLDGSDFSEQALTTVQQLFGRADVRLHLARMVDEAPDDEAAQHLEQIGNRLNREGGSVTWEVGEDDAAKEINQIAGKVDADLIAMATHGRSGVKRLVLGSVAEQVLHAANQPLLLVRPA